MTKARTAGRASAKTGRPSTPGAPRPVKGKAGTVAARSVGKVTKGKGNPMIGAIGKKVSGKTRSSTSRATGTVKGKSGAASPFASSSKKGR